MLRSYQYEIAVWSLEDGDAIEPWETVMTIEGPYWKFAHLETPLLGVLARRTLLATNMHEVMVAANGKPVIYMGARHDHWCVQEGDGYSAIQAGLSISTRAQGAWMPGTQEQGTMPHSLIAAFGGDTVKAAIAFAERYKDETDVIVLVDFENDCARTAVEVATALKERGLPLWGVRLDTSEKLVDEGLIRITPPGGALSQGVNLGLVRLVRDQLDSAGFPKVKIIVSGGFDVKKIAFFERWYSPVDAYGVGSSLLRGSNDFTADIVTVDGEPCAKVGRQENPNPRLKRQL
jgi:nicotinate phosphoribosyltransferase